MSKNCLTISCKVHSPVVKTWGLGRKKKIYADIFESQNTIPQWGCLQSIFKSDVPQFH